MNRRSRTITVDGVQYEAREMIYATMREVRRLNTKGEDPTGAIIAGCIYKADGTPVCPTPADVDELPIRVLEPFANAAVAVSGMDEKGKATPGKSTSPSRRKSG